MTFSRIICLAILSGITAAPALAQLEVPSGQSVTLYDLILEEEVARFRFLAPALGGDAPLGYAEVADDFAHLCAAYALPALEANEITPRQIVISMSDRETVFGEAMPDAIQLFEAFRLSDGLCVWEPL